MNQNLVWLTNIPTPYRVDLWRALAATTRLRVITLGLTEPDRTWDGHALLDIVDGHMLDARAFHWHGSTYYLPNRRLRKAVCRPGSTVVIDGWDSPAYIAALAMAHAAGNPVVVGYRGHALSQRHPEGPVSWVRSQVLRRADAVLTAGGPSTRAALEAGVREEAIIEGINAVNVSVFAAQARNHRDSHGGHRFLYVGQLVQRKNILSVMAAFARMRASQDELRIVGSGPLAETIAAEALRLGIGGSTVLAGELLGEDLVRAYVTADTLVLASTEEVFGLVVPEALATGCHAVVSRTCGVAEAVVGMPGVFVCEPSVDGLARAMAASRDSYRGPIANPPILASSVAAAADRVLVAVGQANSRRQGRRIS